MNKLLANKELYNQIAELIHSAQNKVVNIINHTIVFTYFKIGELIVQEEQNGKEKADYGKKLIQNLSIQLTDQFGSGFSETNLKQMRLFFLSYSEIQLIKINTF